MRKFALGAALAALCAVAAVPTVGNAQGDPNPAMNAPDMLAWQFFAMVNQGAGGTNVLFETWANDTDTFQQKPFWPGKATPLSLHLPAVDIMAREQAQRDGKPLPAIPPNGSLEESRRNLATFKFIVDHGLYKKSGLKAAFADYAKTGVPISFPVDSMEVKANWVAVSDIFTKTTYKGAVADIPKFFHINTGAKGIKYALVAMHIISKQVPNWTWATFESRFNPARCDIIGCEDKFGMKPAYTASNAKPSQGYGDCVKTDALKKLLAGAKLGAAFDNYCLKGSQTDFTDNTGLAIRLGNSITEHTFVDRSSCMTCHGEAGWDAAGTNTPFRKVVGSPDPHVYWNVPTPVPATANYPHVRGGQTPVAMSADFVWAIPFCAYDDSDPKNPQPSNCAGSS